MSRRYYGDAEDRAAYYDQADSFDGDGPEETPEEAATQAWLDEVWGGDAA